MTYKITPKLHIICLSLSFILFYLLYSFVTNCTEQLFMSKLIEYPTQSITLNYFILSLGLVAVISVIHELIHAFCYKIFGGKPIIGFKYIYAYTMETSKVAISANKFVIILLAPLVVISLITLPFNNWILNYVFFLNLVGATGDIVMTLVVLRYGKNGKIIDNKKGFEVVYNK